MAKRLNPVEFLIFGVIATGFGLSAFGLFQEREGFESTLLSPMASNPTSESRSPASAPLFSQVDFSCNSKQEVHVKASKIRINGPICHLSQNSGQTGNHESGSLSKTTIINSTNQFSATVFTDSKEGRFSTDYIPLNPEKNSIKIQFTYASGRNVSHELTLIKD